jgi:hypothetical protein
MLVKVFALFLRNAINTCLVMAFSFSFSSTGFASESNSLQGNPNRVVPVGFQLIPSVQGNRPVPDKSSNEGVSFANCAFSKWSQNIRFVTLSLKRGLASLKSGSFLAYFPLGLSEERDKFAIPSDAFASAEMLLLHDSSMSVDMDSGEFDRNLRVGTRDASNAMELAISKKLPVVFLSNNFDELPKALAAGPVTRSISAWYLLRLRMIRSDHVMSFLRIKTKATLPKTTD